LYVDVSYLVVSYKCGLGILEALLSVVCVDHGYLRRKIIFTLASNACDVLH